MKLEQSIDKDKEIMKNAPKISEYLNEKSINHFNKVKEYLEAMEIPYEVNENLVRGLDYYTHTVFEIEAQVEGFGSQNVLCGGGRYDSLVSNIGGPDVCGVGFATGIERLLTALEYEDVLPKEEKSIDTYIIPMDDESKKLGIKLTNIIRMNGFKADIDEMSRNIKGNFKQADRLNAKYVIIIGEEELNTNILTIKNNNTKEEYKVNIDELIEFLDKNIEEEHHE